MLKAIGASLLPEQKVEIATREVEAVRVLVQKTSKQGERLLDDLQARLFF